MSTIRDFFRTLFWAVIYLVLAILGVSALGAIIVAPLVLTGWLWNDPMLGIGLWALVFLLHGAWQVASEKVKNDGKNKTSSPGLS